MKKKEMKIFRKFLSKRILLSIQLVASMIFLFCVYLLNIVPGKYYALLVALLIILFLSTAAFITSGVRNKKKFKKKTKLFFSKSTSLIVSGTLIIGSFYVVRGNDFFARIGNAFQQTRVFNVYVLKESKAKTIDDLKKDTFGVEYTTDSKNMTLASSKVEEKLKTTITTKEANDYMLLADDLYNGQVDAIIADQARMDLLEANHEHFEAQTRIIDTIELTEKLDVVTTKTNVTEKPFMVYLTGIDTYGNVSTVSRTDVNLIVCVSPKERQVLMVSIPRDTEVVLASYNKMDKLTHSAMYGINETIKTIEKFLDLKMNYYAKTNFSGIIDIIDELGTITIDSPSAFTTLHGNYDIVKGPNEMDGDKALCFVRERKNLPNGDFDRGRNQQLLLKAMLSKMMSSKIITNYNSILGAIEGCFETNMSSEEIKSLITMQLNDMSGWDILNVQVPGEPSTSNQTMSMKGQTISTTVPDKEGLKKIIEVIDKIESGQRINESDVKGLN